MCSQEAAQQPGRESLSIEAGTKRRVISREGAGDWRSRKLEVGGVLLKRITAVRGVEGILGVDGAFRRGGYMGEITVGISRSGGKRYSRDEDQQC